jgi:predicted ThiF/HesA family dinucleotide-utilizing enzyme
VAESNINRQVQALGATLGQSKALALRLRIADIHPGCEVHAIEEFADESNWPALLPQPVDAVIDACDQVRAKAAIAAGALQTNTALIVAGAAGGKRKPQAVQVADLAQATHEVTAVVLIAEDHALFEPPHHHVVQDSRSVQAYAAWHGRISCALQPIMSIYSGVAYRHPVRLDGNERVRSLGPDRKVRKVATSL